MPKTEKQRKAAFAELTSRKQGKSLGMFKGMKKGELKDYAHSNLDTKGKAKGKSKDKGRGRGKRSNRFSAADQAAALR